MLRALGVTLELTPAEEGMIGTNRRAKERYRERENVVMVRKFGTEANRLAHHKTIWPEIRMATGGEVDAVVAGVGTGGTITGATEHIRENREHDGVTAVVVEPAESPTLTEHCSEGNDIQGIGPWLISDARSICQGRRPDETATVRDW